MMAFENDSMERLYIDSIHSRLTEPERLVRMALINEIIDSGGSLDDEAVAALDARYDLDVEAIALSLLNKRVMVKNADGDIAFIYPVSGLPTPHKVYLQDGRVFHAMCAVDAPGAAFTFEQNVSVASVCSHCKAPIKVEIRDGKFTALEPATTHVLHTDLNKIENWAAGC
jgi:hypothetical protein